VNSGLKAETSDNGKTRGRQRDFSDNAVGSRILSALSGRTRKWLAKETGISESSISDYVANGIAKADAAVSIASALNVSVDWLLTGSGQSSDLLSVEDADWVEVHEHDLRELTDESLGPVVSTTPFRKDWLYRTFGRSSGFWLAKLPADLPRLDLRQGDPVFLRDVEDGEAQDGATYIVRVSGHLTVARIDAMLSAQMKPIERNLEDRRLAPRDIGPEDGQAALVARILGRPLAPIR